MNTIAICGSMKFAKEMDLCKKGLEEFGLNVYAPAGIENLDSYKEAGSTKEAIKRKVENDYIRAHYDLIKKSEGVLILNYDKNGISNYIGGNTLMEMGFAFTQNRDIFLLHEIPDVSYRAEIEAMQPIVLNDDLKKIKNYYEGLPKVYIASDNVLKVSATSKAFREFDYRYDVIGIKTVSGISEEPFTIDETYIGAQNRLKDLKKKVKGKKYKYLVAIECGDIVLHKEHNMWGLSVCVIENFEGKRFVTIDTDLEVPKEMTDLVPSEYPDLGVLVQQKYGVKNKDPYIYLTGGKLGREKLLFNSVVNTLANF